jgi:hypothetical protein
MSEQNQAHTPSQPVASPVADAIPATATYTPAPQAPAPYVPEQQHAPIHQAPYAQQPGGYGAPMGAVDQRVAMAEMAAISQAKSTGTAYLLWFFLGALGVHKFYLGKVGIGIAYFFTLGFLGIGLLIDLFTLPKQVRDANMLRRAQVRTQMGV